MFIGINWTSSNTSNLICEIAKNIKVDFCELLIDNFLLYEPEVIKEVLPTHKCAFHIMHSHFLHRDLNDLIEYANRIKKAANILEPIYISDHIGIFEHGKRRFPIMQEVTYDGFFEFFKQKAYIWSELLEYRIYYENYPSFEPQPLRQVEFLSQVQNELKTHANILFDFSNAIIAEKNGCEKAVEWKEVALKTKHFHVGGYEKPNNLNYYLDSHNQAISDTSLKLLAEFENILCNVDSTLTIERDSNLKIKDWQEDIKMVRGLNNVLCSY